MFISARVPSPRNDDDEAKHRPSSSTGGSTSRSTFFCKEEGGRATGESSEREIESNGKHVTEREGVRNEFSKRGVYAQEGFCLVL